MKVEINKRVVISSGQYLLTNELDKNQTVNFKFEPSYECAFIVVRKNLADNKRVNLRKDDRDVDGKYQGLIIEHNGSAGKVFAIPEPQQLFSRQISNAEGEVSMREQIYFTLSLDVTINNAVYLNIELVSDDITHDQE